MQEQLKTEALLDLSKSLAGSRLRALTYPWEALDFIGDWIAEIGAALDKEEYTEIQPRVWVAKSATIAPTASITGPCIIGPETEVRPGAFIRGKALVGRKCVVGNSTELKNVILFDQVQVPHYNYVGDSILGFKAHMGAGSITSNVKSDRSLVSIKLDHPVLQGHLFDGANKIFTQRKKMGAILGDYVEVGCNSVLNPGTVVGRHSTIYPLTPVRGFIPSHHICKSMTTIVAVEERV